MSKMSFPVVLSSGDQAQLEQWESAHGTPQQVALRCRIVLSAFVGEQNQAMAFRLQVSRPMVNLWRKRVRDLGIGQIWEIAPGRGRKPHYKGLTHWSCRTMAAAQNVSKDTVNRLWQRHQIKPHLSRTFKLSRDAQFLEKLTAMVGLYLNPPQKAMGLCLDEKSQIQALDRTQPGLPLKEREVWHDDPRLQAQRHDDAICGSNVLDGQVVGECHARHRHQEWLKFLRRLDREYPSDLKLHLMMDNYGTHKEPHVRAWLKQHRRFICHFILTSSSWLNLVDQWFAELTEQAIRRGSFVSGPDLQAAIGKFLEVWNPKPKPFIWTAKVEDIIKKTERARAKLEEIKPGCTQPRAKKKAD